MVNKLILGLVGIVLGFSGCSKNLSSHEEVIRLRDYNQKIKEIYTSGEDLSEIDLYDKKIRSILGINENDNYFLIGNLKGEIFGALIAKENGEKFSIAYIDKDKNGVFDGRLSFGGKVRVLGIIPPDPNEIKNLENYKIRPRFKPKNIIPEKKKKDRKLIAYRR